MPPDYERRRSEQEAARNMELAKRCWRLSGCPERHKEATLALSLANAEWAAALAKTTDRALDCGMVALIGGRGTGKTQIAVTVAKTFCKSRRQSVTYTRAADLFIAIRDCYRKDAPRRESDVIRDYARVGLLIVDELNERAESDAENRLLTLILDKRYADCRATILIGNLTGGDAAERASLRHNIGESAFDRLTETGGFIECNWASFRTERGE
jgi:DNA replication protein DnaC